MTMPSSAGLACPHCQSARCLRLLGPDLVAARELCRMVWCGRHSYWQNQPPVSSVKCHPSQLDQLHLSATNKYIIYGLTNSFLLLVASLLLLVRHLLLEAMHLLLIASCDSMDRPSGKVLGIKGGKLLSISPATPAGFE